MFKKKKPCNNCPFLKNSPMKLEKERLPGIVESLEDGGDFICHKTIDYENQIDEETGMKTHYLKQNQFCAGAIIYLEKNNLYSDPLEKCQRLGLYKPEDYLKHKDMVINSMEERSVW
ncbi:hypothetical protein [Priestia megaterium]|uniref:Uncharacterized protein n=1 Tax=Priestia megaterium TaxID=1404 RepID=A0A6M6E2U0_PRIMG|nr:hypothetical protein [Priestia megaterium]QJX80036.1 hypothetical protein FDZ14_28440 [Priestia megaterium]